MHESQYNSLSREELQVRLADAENVCVLFGWTGAHMDSERDKALHQLWSEWAKRYGVLLSPGAHPELSDAYIARLAADRDRIRQLTLDKIRRVIEL